MSFFICFILLNFSFLFFVIFLWFLKFYIQFFSFSILIFHFYFLFDFEYSLLFIFLLFGSLFFFIGPGTIMSFLSLTQFQTSGNNSQRERERESERMKKKRQWRRLCDVFMRYFETFNEEMFLNILISFSRHLLSMQDLTRKKKLPNWLMISW